MPLSNTAAFLLHSKLLTADISGDRLNEFRRTIDVIGILTDIDQVTGERYVRIDFGMQLSTAPQTAPTVTTSQGREVGRSHPATGTYKHGQKINANGCYEGDVSHGTETTCRAGIGTGHNTIHPTSSQDNLDYLNSEYNPSAPQSVSYDPFAIQPIEPTIPPGAPGQGPTSSAPPQIVTGAPVIGGAVYPAQWKPYSGTVNGCKLGNLGGKGWCPFRSRPSICQFLDHLFAAVV